MATDAPQGSAQQRREQIDARDAVDHAVVHLADQCGAIALDPLDDPQLPERFPGVELLRHDARDQPLELSLAPRAR